jgi:DNA-binding protein YbaB
MSMFSKLKQFKDLRDQGKKLQEALGTESVTVRELGDKVVLTIDGNLQMTGLAIDPEVLTPDKKEKLENAIKNAHSDALKKMQRIIASKMQEMGGFPGLGGGQE